MPPKLGFECAEVALVSRIGSRSGYLSSLKVTQGFTGLESVVLSVSLQQKEADTDS